MQNADVGCCNTLSSFSFDCFHSVQVWQESILCLVFNTLLIVSWFFSRVWCISSNLLFENMVLISRGKRFLMKLALYFCFQHVWCGLLSQVGRMGVVWGSSEKYFWSDALVGMFQFVGLECIITGFADEFLILRRWKKTFKFVVCLMLFLIGISCCTQVRLLLFAVYHSFSSFIYSFSK